MDNEAVHVAPYGFEIRLQKNDWQSGKAASRFAMVCSLILENKAASEQDVELYPGNGLDEKHIQTAIRYAHTRGTRALVWAYLCIPRTTLRAADRASKIFGLSGMLPPVEVNIKSHI